MITITDKCCAVHATYQKVHRAGQDTEDSAMQILNANPAQFPIDF